MTDSLREAFTKAGFKIVDNDKVSKATSLIITEKEFEDIIAYLDAYFNDQIEDNYLAKWEVAAHDEQVAQGLPHKTTELCHNCGMELWSYEDRLQCLTAGCGAYSKKDQ